MSSTKKNGKIEALRFIFCIYVILFHFDKYSVFKIDNLPDGMTFFQHGSIAVEFFFLLSGFLMAKSIYRQVSSDSIRRDDRSNSKNYVSFILRKVYSLLPYHVVAFVFAFVTYCIKYNCDAKELVYKLLLSIPNFLLLGMTGANFSNPNSFEWYISVMLLAMAILYPLCRRFYYSFSRFFAPLISALIIGYLCKTTASLSGVEVWMNNMIYKGFLRGIAELCLGVFAFELSRYISKFSFTKKQKVCFTIIEIACFVFISLFSISSLSKKLELICLYAMFVMIVFSFSNVTFGQRLFNNKFFYYLGSLSLPLYLSQAVGCNLIAAPSISQLPVTTQILIFVFSIILTTIIVKFSGKVLYEKSKLLHAIQDIIK